MSIFTKKKETFNDDSLWKVVKELANKGRFEEANKIIGQIYRKYGEKYN